MAITRVQIYDMDGTIVDSTHRYRTVIGADGVERIDLQYWRENEYRAMDDSLLPLAAQYKADLADPNCYVIIATARVLNDPDIRFINEILGKPDYIISRKPNSNISGGVLKVNGLRKFLNLKNFKNAVFTFYEDNKSYLNKVVSELNINGVFCQSNQGH